eukprot:583115-Hanusia_phi.AAC.1
MYDWARRAYQALDLQGGEDGEGRERFSLIMLQIKEKKYWDIRSSERLEMMKACFANLSPLTLSFLDMVPGLRSLRS